MAVPKKLPEFSFNTDLAKDIALSLWIIALFTHVA